MEQSKKKSNYLRLALRDIKNGFSEVNILGNPFYLKHMSFDDQVDIDLIYDDYYQLALSKNLPTHEAVLEQLIEEGQWSKKREREIKEQEDFIDNLIKQKKAHYLRSEIERINKDIEEAQKKLNELKNGRAALFSRTAESYAEERVNDFYILKCLYKDAELKKIAYTQEEFDEIDSEMLFAIIKEYNKVYKYINDESIQKIVLEDFYNLYMPFAENAMEFYGKAICSLSYNQLKLLIYSRFFKNIFQQHDKMPEEIKKDPDKIMDYINANENAKKIMEKKGNKENNAESIVGATNEDLEYLGLKGKNQKTLSLSDEAKKKGGSLSMDDMMKLFG
jgi:hypothetical protein